MNAFLYNTHNNLPTLLSPRYRNLRLGVAGTIVTSTLVGALAHQLLFLFPLAFAFRPIAGGVDQADTHNVFVRPPRAPVSCTPFHFLFALPIRFAHLRRFVCLYKYGGTSKNML